TEPESLFDIMADGNRIGGFTVKQAKKPGISVATATVYGGSGAVSGSFTASTWDVKSTAYVTSSNGNMGITLPSSNNGTFTVGMAADMDQSFVDRSATIKLVGVNGDLGSCEIAQKKITYTFNVTGLEFKFNDTAGKDITVTATNIGAVTSGMTATSSQTWCTPTASGNTVTVTVQANGGSSSRNATVYVTYKNCRSQTFDVVQGYDVPATVTIGGVTWSSFNVDTPGKLAASVPSALLGTRQDSRGKFYQWNRKVAWSTNGDVSGWNATTPSGNTWETANNPCPEGFIVPSNTQWTALISACNATYYMGGTWSATNYGYLTLTDKTNSANKLEFPAVGYLNHPSGALADAGICGPYWASTSFNADKANRMYFASGGVSMGSNYKMSGFSVRCIQDRETVTIGGAQWALYNVDQPGTVVASLPSALTGTRAASQGKFYQWNRNVSWSTTGYSVIGWDASTPSGSSWGSSTNPCPSGFVVPTQHQWSKLIAACNATYMSGTWSSTNYGYLTLTAKSNSSELEFLAVGYRNTDGSLKNCGTEGYYWSYDQSNTTNAYGMGFNNGRVGTSGYDRRYGYSVRCVRQ
ncbi:MAG: hypothetical protein K2L01_08250, partial [Rikenellaceae bacterium]|nr:hypothetical protein [Rikenellaceae bacterium]